jgi:phospholipase A1
MKNSRIKMCYIKGKSLTRFILCLLIFSSITKASNNNLVICLAEKAKSENQDLTLGELNRICNKVVADDEKNQPAVEKRFNSERRLAYHPFVITPHHMNYILPVTYTDKINQSAYDDKGNWPQNLDNMEAKLQISFKVPLLTESLFNEGDAIAFSFTLQSWWQMYNQELSRPFRETNYNPELFYFTPLDFEIGGGKTGFF